LPPTKFRERPNEGAQHYLPSRSDTTKIGTGDSVIYTVIIETRLDKKEGILNEIPINSGNVINVMYMGCHMALSNMSHLDIIRTGYERYHVESLIRRLLLGTVSQYNSAAKS
jgi:hypothetical protein